jgi:hypothetical protein
MRSLSAEFLVDWRESELNVIHSFLITKEVAMSVPVIPPLVRRVLID